MMLHCPVCCAPVDTAHAYDVATRVEGVPYHAYCCSIRCRVAYVLNPKLYADAAAARKKP